MDRRRPWFVLHACPLLVFLGTRIASATEISAQGARAERSSPRSTTASESPTGDGSGAESTARTASAAEAGASAKAGNTTDRSETAVRPAAQRINLIVPDLAVQQGGPRRNSSTVLSPHDAQSAPQTTPSLRLPAFIVLGVGGLSAGGAVVTGIVERNRQYDPKYDCARCDGDRALDQKLSLATKVLAGVAALGVSTGLVLLLTAPKEKGTFTPSLGVNVSGSKATAKVTWKF